MLFEDKIGAICAYVGLKVANLAGCFDSTGHCKEWDDQNFIAKGGLHLLTYGINISPEVRKAWNDCFKN